VPGEIGGFDLDPHLTDRLTLLVARAGEAILAIRRAALDVRAKVDGSPVTAADHASDAVLAEGLARLVPGMPVVSEETWRKGCCGVLGETFALVDPLDGTKEFIAGSKEYTVNVAIVRGGRPFAGFVAAPALGLVFRGVVGGKAERLRLGQGGDLRCEAAQIRTRPWPEGSGDATAIVSRSHLDAETTAFLDRLPVARRTPCGSALKFCRIAEGEADVYPRLGPTSEWDIAAGHALILAAGGLVVRPDGSALRYGQADAGFRVAGFVAWGDPAAAEAARR
jgi:3'(2'), 5'-bisphosphate nucleotidase